MAFEAADKVDSSPEEKDFYELVERFPESLSGRRYGPYEENPYSFAPIRSKPQRTYDPLKETISPEGSDIPMVLMNMFRTNEEEWKELKERLIEFGKSSGLFSDIHVRRLGKSMGDPFQLQIKVKGPKVNMIDVGYGVNQLLPILVRMLNSRPGVPFLMQQPEVHLHPRGQAELSSLLIDLIKQRKHNFIIETHSDYMLDRARIEIMKKRIAPEDVSLIYLEPAGNSVKVHNITFDEQANLLGAPGSYREFFLKESDKLLGFD
jgi:predicted ATPase